MLFPMMITNIGLPGLLLITLFGVIYTIPFWKLLPKFGLNKFISLLCLIPFLNTFVVIILLWVVAFSEPRIEEAV
jgi:hypothetical protein